MAVRRGQVEALIRIVGEDKITSLLSDVEKSLANTEDATDANTKATKKYAHIVGSVEDSWSAVTTGINQMIELASKAANVIGGLHEQAKIGATEIGIEKRFIQLTAKIGGAGNALQLLKTAAKEGMGRSEIERLANDALAAGIKLGDVAKLFDMGAKIASARGLDQAEVTQEVIKGIVEESDAIFRASSLQVDFGKELGLTATKLGLLPDLLTVNERRTNHLNTAVRGMNETYAGFEVDETIAKLNRWEAALKDLKTATRLEALETAGLAPRLAKTRDLWKSLVGVGTSLIGVDLKHASDATRAILAAGKLAEANEKRIEIAKKLNKVLAEDPLSKFAIDIELTRRAGVLAAKTDRKQQEVKEELIKKYHLQSSLMLQAKEDQENLTEATKGETQSVNEAALAQINYRISMGDVSAMRVHHIHLSKVQAEREAKSEAIRSAAAASTIRKIVESNGLRALQAMSEARVAQAQGRSTIAATRYQEVLDKLPAVHARTAKEATRAAEATAALDRIRADTPAEDYAAKAATMIAADQRAAQSTLGVQTALYYKYKAMGLNRPAAIAYNKAMGAVRKGAKWTVRSLDMVALAAGNAAAQLRSGLTAQAKLSIAAGKLLMADADADMRSAGVAMVNAAEVTLRKIRGIVVKTTALRVPGGGGGGGGGAKAALTEAQLWAKAQENMGEWKAVRDEMVTDFGRVGDSFATLGKVQRSAMSTTVAEGWAQLFDPDMAKRTEDAEAYVLRRQTAMKAKYQKDIAAATDKHNARMNQKRIKENKPLQDWFKKAHDTELAALKEHLARKIEVEATALERFKEFAAARQRINDLQIQTQQDALNRSIGFAGEFGNRWVSAFGSGLTQLGPEVDRVTEIFALAEKAGVSSGKAFAKAAPGMLAASGAIVGGFIEDTETRALVQSLFEFAAAAASYAYGDIRGGIMHTLAGSMYAAVAGGATKGKGGGGASKAPQTITKPPTPQQGGPASQITLNISGTIVGNDEAAGRQLASMIQKEMKWGSMK